MINGAKRARPYSVRRTRSLIRAALASEVRPPNFDPKTLTGGQDSLVKSLPAWVKRFGFLAGAGHYCLWCNPLPSPRDTFPNQIILDIPRGRYFVDTLDAVTLIWVSCESAEGGPLIVGLPFTGNPVLVWIRASKS
jgi:hypothetical protein